MKLFNIFMKKSEMLRVETAPRTIYAPVDGTVIPLNEIQDPVFGSGSLGEGCGINPISEIVLAPFNGEVTMIADTLHAVGLISNDGIELLIHVGMDTVEMNGKGFATFVKVGQKVQMGDKLLSFSILDIEAAGFSPAIVVCNTNEAGYIKIIKMGEVQAKEPMMKVN